MRKSLQLVVVIMLLLSVIISACAVAVPDFVLVADSSAKKYLGEDCNSGLLKLFKDKSKICVSVVYKDNVQINVLQETAVAGNNSLGANAFLVADGVWLNEKLTSPVKVAETNIPFGVDSAKAVELGWIPGSAHGIGEVADLMSAGQLKTVVCNANQCNAGAMFFTGIVNRLKGDTGNPPTMADFNNQNIIDAAKQFYENVARSGASSDEAATIYLQDKVNDSNLYNAIVLEEPIGADLNTQLTTAGKSPVTFFYLKDANVVSSPTMGYLDNGNDQTKEVYNSLKEFMTGSEEVGYDAQKLIASTGWGSVAYGIASSTSVLKPEWGFVASPNVAFVPVPKRAVMIEAVRIYALYYKKPADIVIILDNSGSMQDNQGFEGLKEAIGKITDLGWLANNQLYPSENDSIKVFLFGSRIQGPYIVTGNNQENLDAFRKQLFDDMGNFGATYLYDAAKIALDTAIENQNKAHNTVVVLMTDGVPTDGWERKQFINYYKQTGTTIPIISIAFGEDASRELGYDDFGKYVNGLYYDGSDLVKAFAQVWGGN